MKETDRASKDALDAARKGDVESATKILEPLAEIDPRPLFYWWAKAEIARVEGDQEKQASFLRLFGNTLFGRKLELLGYNEPGLKSPDDLTKNEPEELRETKKVAAVAWQEKAWNEAIALYQQAIELEIADLAKLGDNIFE